MNVAVPASAVSGTVVVQKFGGSSVATPEALRGVAHRVVQTRRNGYQVVVVVSAMGDTTDELLSLAGEVSPDPWRRELDVVLATGERVSAALLAMAIRDLGEDAVSLSGGQCGIVTNDVHANARIVEIRPQRIREELARGRIVVAAGYQGVNPAGEETTLGRGGSDTTAVALAAALGAERCDIFTDVEGVFSADPRVVDQPRLLGELSFEEMEELAWQGARVLKAEAVELARDNGVVLGVGSARGEGVLSRVGLALPGDGYLPRRSPVAGVAGRSDLVRVSIRVGSAREFPAEVLAALAGYDLVFQRVGASGCVYELFLASEEIPSLEAFRAELTDRPDAAVEVSELLGAVSLVGFGLGTRPSALAAALTALRGAGMVPLDSFSSRESLTFLLPVEQVRAGINLLHKTFIEHLDQLDEVAVTTPAPVLA